MTEPVTVAPENNAKPTAERILDIAERLVQTRGFTNFSYADIAAELGITKASLHYHFPGKAELGQAVIARYGERFADALVEIDRTVPDARAKLEAYAGLYADVLRGNRMCMCGVLAGEYETLPDPMRAAVIRFFDDNQTWLVHVLDDGLQDRTLAFSGSKEDVAQTILVTLEGAMLVARPYGDLGRFTAASQQLIIGLTGSGAV
ncbi:MAG TPA: TetR/AcrR family transcriptional regulator [Solirubrobacteraceae bacterium]|jgi:TetR/AcrR family transcriptional repressor of nem operon|nr:TetR/AcrR family transcriptional regulator [Solirubrobacteraceae bacterium]